MNVCKTFQQCFNPEIAHNYQSLIEFIYLKMEKQTSSGSRGGAAGGFAEGADEGEVNERNVHAKITKKAVKSS